MKIAIFSSSDTNGGAAIAACRNAEALLRRGHSVDFYVQFKHTDFFWVHHLPGASNLSGLGNKIQERLGLIARTHVPKTQFHFSPCLHGNKLSNTDFLDKYDAILLNWVHHGFVSLAGIESILSIQKPVYWTMHDLWVMTGGCHYTNGCQRFETGCIACPQLKSSSRRDLAKEIWTRKKQMLPGRRNLHFVACSDWLRSVGQKSSMLRATDIHAIPNAIDINAFYPMPREDARLRLKLPLDKKLILFSAYNVANERKGFVYFREAIRLLSEKAAQGFEVVIFGQADERIFEGIPCKVHYLGHLSGAYRIIDAYNAADVLVMPSLEDNLPVTIQEAMACAVPVVAFNNGGIPEMIEHKESGWLAQSLNARDLAEGIHFVIEDDERLKHLRQRSRQLAIERFSYEVVGRQYESLFKQFQQVIS